MNALRPLRARAYDPRVPSSVELASLLRAHPDLWNLIWAIDSGDWPSVRDLLERPSTTSDRTYLRAFAADTAGIGACLGPHADDDPVAGALLARVEVAEAWQVRSGQRAEHVGPEQFREFRRRLVLAEQRLTRLIAQRPDHPDAWVVRLLTARGLELDHSEARRRWARVQHLHPGDFWAHTAMLQYWAPKWFGSWDLLFGFARESAAEAPAGSPLHALVGYAQVERWLDLDGGAAGRHYLRSPEAAELTVAGATQGPAHADYRRGYGGAELDNVFAMLFSVAGAPGYARVHFRRLDGLISDHPWRYLQGDPQAVYDDHRHRASQPGAGS